MGEEEKRVLKELNEDNLKRNPRAPFYVYKYCGAMRKTNLYTN